MGLKSQYTVAVVNEINDNTTVTFGAGDVQSSVLTCGGTAPTGIILPAEWTTCDLSFYACKTPTGTFLPITNFNATSFVLATQASLWIPLQPSMFNSILYLKLVCNTAQVSALTVDVCLAPIFQGVHS